MKKILSVLTITALSAAGASAAVTASNLLAFYDFNGNANDGSGNGANATLNLGAVISADGAGYSGNAGDSALDVGPSTPAGGAGSAAHAAATVNFLSATTANSMAVSFWQYDLGNGAGGNASTTAFTAVSSSGGGTRGFQAHTPWGDSNVYFDHGGACCAVPANRLSGPVGTAGLDSWHHVVLQVDNGAKQIWIDGGLAYSQATGAAAIPSFTGELVIGAEQTAINGFGGRIDEFAVWDVALDQSEIQALAGGASTLSILPIPEPSTGLLALLGGLLIFRRRR